MNQTDLRVPARLAAGALCLALGACADVGAAEAPAEKTQEVRYNGAPPRFTLFESGQVRPLALSADGRRLYAVNTPDNRLEIFDVRPQGLVRRGSVAVGLEPVAVAVRGDDEVWVVNHLSDSVSVVDAGSGRVVRTLLVGDEPRDVVFAGPQRRRAFITTAHRGQNSPSDPATNTPGLGRADVWVFDATALGTSLGGTPLTVLTLFADKPRALAVSPDGRRVYAAGFMTGNRTTAINPVTTTFGPGLPPPFTDSAGAAQPLNGLIVRFDGASWRDTLGRVWDAAVAFSLPDKDVFVIDATANPPAQLAGSAGFYAGVGTVLFNMVVNPVSGKVYVSNTEARNEQRFEGPGIFGGSTVRGHTNESRITVLSGAAVTPRHLNKHIDFASCCAPLPNAENARSVASPTDMAVSSDGRTLYVAAFGSSEIAIYDTAQLETNTFVPSTTSQITVSGGGPSGVVLDEGRRRLYVMARFSNELSVIDLTTRSERQTVALPDPEPPSVVRGRPFLYDAAETSSHGDSSCASCHVYGDFDGLSWDLGNPDETTTPLLNPVVFLPPPIGTPVEMDFKSMKGPMNTQSLRGMANHGAMHWRGDRNGAAGGPSVQPNGGAFDENAAFNAFNVAFAGLLGRSAPLPAADMQAFTDFALQISYPPNPIRNLDNSLTPAQQVGRDHFFQPATTFITFSCNDCHRLDPGANAGEPFPGFFGTSGLTVFDAANDAFDGGKTPLKTPHLRNLYQKVGMFGLPDIVIPGVPLPPGTGFVGDQIRGFGFTHDGSVNLDFFLGGAVFSNLISPNGFPATFRPDGAFVPTPEGRQLLDNLFAFLMAFDSNLAPVVGQQITLTQGNAAVAGARVTLLASRAAAHECELVAKGQLAGVDLSFLYDGAGRFYPDRHLLPPVSDAALRLLTTLAGVELTFTCAPPGSGRRLGLDADLDGWLDGDEHDAGSDPRDPQSTP